MIASSRSSEGNNTFRHYGIRGQTVFAPGLGRQADTRRAFPRFMPHPGPADGRRFRGSLPSTPESRGRVALRSFQRPVWCVVDTTRDHQSDFPGEGAAQEGGLREESGLEVRGEPRISCQELSTPDPHLRARASDR